MSTNTITPPAGFELEQSNQAVPTQNTITPPNGFVLESPAVQEPHAQAPERPTSETIAQGFGAGAAEGLITAGKIASTIPGLPWVAEKAGDVIGLPKLAPGTDPYKTVEEGIKPAQQQATSTTSGKVGYGLEGLAEFISGDEVLKGLGYGEKLLKTGRIAKLIEEIPTLKRVFEIGLNAARTGTVGTAQGLTHGETTGEALESGAIAGGTGAALEGLGEGVKAVAPKVRKIAGELIPIRASQESKIANLAENVAPTKNLSKFDIEQTQPAVKRAIGNIATDVKNVANERMAAADAEAAITKLRAATSKAADLSEAAEQIKAQAKPVFQRLDELTKDQPMKFSDWQKEESAAYRRGDIEAAKKAKDAQGKILDTFKDKFDPNDLKNARANWRQASALQDIHDSLNTKAVVGPTPVELRPQGVPDPGYINGKSFSKQILKLTNDGTLEQAGLTPEHIQSLQDLGILLEKSANVHKFGQLARLTELGGAGLTAVLHPAAAVAGAKVAVPAYLAQRALGRVMTNPDTAETFVNLLRGAEVVAPAMAAQVTNAVQK